jgi:hypothetical protein
LGAAASRTTRKLGGCNEQELNSVAGPIPKILSRDMKEKRTLSAHLLYEAGGVDCRSTRQHCREALAAAIRCVKNKWGKNKELWLAFDVGLNRSKGKKIGATAGIEG